MEHRNHAVLILTHGRPDRVITVDTLRKSGYTGRIFIVVDDHDKTLEEYKKKYGSDVVVFNKKRAGELTDSGDNFGSLRGVVYARNIAFEIAADLGLTHFLELDDDYTSFQYRFDGQFNYNPKTLKNLDGIIEAFYTFLDETGADCIAMAQGGDFIGGDQGQFAHSVSLRRKLMNSFFCRVDRPFKFLGRINEDTTLYVDGGVRGKLFFTANQVNLNQIVTQQNKGGLTEIYLDSGTYVKSFYTVMYQPSCVKVSTITGQRGTRLHHRVSWEHAVPKIIPEKFKKVTA